MRGEVAITQSEPGFAAQGVELLHHSPTLTFEAPAELVVVETGQGVHDRVEVGTDRESVHSEVVTDVHNRGDLTGVERVAQRGQQSRRTHTTAENRYHLETLRGLRYHRCCEHELPSRRVARHALDGALVTEGRLGREDRRRGRSQ